LFSSTSIEKFVANPTINRNSESKTTAAIVRLGLRAESCEMNCIIVMAGPWNRFLMNRLHRVENEPFDCAFEDAAATESTSFTSWMMTVSGAVMKSERASVWVSEWC